MTNGYKELCGDSSRDRALGVQLRDMGSSPITRSKKDLIWKYIS